MEYKLNQQLIKDLREGRISIDKNLKDWELLRQVLETAFPNGRRLIGYGKNNHYYAWNCPGDWYGTIITTDNPISLLDFIEKEEYKFPEKWCIERNKENSEIVNDYFNKKLNTKAPYKFTSDKKYVYSDITESIDCCSSKPKDYTEITFEQFQKYVLNNTKTMDKEIIGYKVPFDISNGWKKGDVAITTTADKEYWISNKYGRIPKEIVETWEPVYKTSEKVLTLSNDKTIKISKGKIEAQGRDIPIESIEKLLRPYLSTVGGWGVELKDAKYKIGCYENVALADIKLIIKEYEELNK